MRGGGDKSGLKVPKANTAGSGRAELRVSASGSKCAASTKESEKTNSAQAMPNKDAVLPIQARLCEDTWTSECEKAVAGAMTPDHEKLRGSRDKPRQLASGTEGEEIRPRRAIPSTGTVKPRFERLRRAGERPELEKSGAESKLPVRPTLCGNGKNSG